MLIKKQFTLKWLQVIHKFCIDNDYEHVSFAYFYKK